MASNQSSSVGEFPSAALREGMRAQRRSAFPVLSGDDVVAVLEFLARVPRLSDAALLELISQIGL